MLLDSSVLVAYFNTSDVHHGKSKNLMEGLPSWIILEPILFETITTLQMRMNKKTAFSAFEFLLAHPKFRLVALSPEDLKESVRIFTAQKGSLTIFDCALLAAGKRTRIPVQSFDKKLNAVYRMG